MKHLRLFFLSSAVVLFFTAISSAQESQLTYWAPGTINRAEGTVEMDVEFLAPRPSLLNSWRFLFHTSGNDFATGTTILGVVLCPPMDSRDFVALVKGDGEAVGLDVPTPDYELNRPYRVAISWGKGQFSLWFDGKLLGREAFRGPIALLPENFRAGLDSDVGLPTGTRIKALRISDMPRSGDILHEAQPLEADEHATLVLSEDGVAAASKPTEWQIKDFASAIFPIRGSASFTTPLGRPFVQPLCLVNFTGSAHEYHLDLAIRDRAGASVASRSCSIKVPANTRYQPSEVAMPDIGKSGYYLATLRVRGPAGQEQVYDLAFVIQPAENLQPGKLSEFLGHHLVPFSKLGYKWMRSWAHDRVFVWSNLEPMQGQFAWAAADRYVEKAKAEGFQILGLLGYPPAWASTFSPEERDRLKIPPGRTYSNSPDRYQPKNLEDWKTYVRAVVSRYHKDVKFWEIYNEVDFHPPTMHASFSGTTADYLELLKSAYEIIKEIDPASQVLVSGFSLNGSTDADMPAELVKAGGAAYFDIFNVHGYATKSILEKNIKLARAAKPDVPVWQTEHMFLDGPSDDYLVATKCFWAISQGIDKFFLHGGEYEKNFGDHRYPGPYFGVTAELARQLRTCDEYLGPVGGELIGVSSWKLRRSDGSWLQVFAVDNGVARLTFDTAGATPDVLITDLYGGTIFRGKLESGTPLDFSKLSYVASSTELKVASCEKKLTNVIGNPGFEIRDGDYAMDESLARPVFWELRPEGSPGSWMSFAPGHTGKYALKLQTPATVDRIQAAQLVMLSTKGNWHLSAFMKAVKGTKLFILLKVKQSGQWVEIARQEVDATGDWQKVSAPAKITARDTQGVVSVGLASTGSQVEIDDLELIHEKAVP